MMLWSRTHVSFQSHQFLVSDQLQYFVRQDSEDVYVCVCAHPGAIIAHSGASSQAGVEVRNAIGATDGSVLVDPAATVDITAARQIPVRHCQSRTADTENVNQKLDKGFT